MATKTLKDENRPLLAAIFTGNALAFIFVASSSDTAPGDVSRMFSDGKMLMPASLTLAFSIVLANLLDTNTKNRLVYWRWRDVLPGHRAFTQHAKDDSRIDVARLERHLGGAVPTDPAEQNRVWYRLYKTVEDAPAVRQNHRRFLLLRDHTGMAALFAVVCGPASAYLVDSRRALWAYIAVLLIQYLLARQAATNCGVRMICTVLAQVAATAVPARSRRGQGTQAKG